MADERPQTRTVTALKFHTAYGEAHEPGDTYDVDADQVDNLVAQGMVAQPAAAPMPARPSQPVTPITAEEFLPKKRRQ